MDHRSQGGYGADFIVFPVIDINEEETERSVKKRTPKGGFRNEMLRYVCAIHLKSTSEQSPQQGGISMKRYRAALFVAVAALLLIPLMAAPAFAQAPTAVDDLNQALVEDGSHTINPLANDTQGAVEIDSTTVTIIVDVVNGTTSIDPVTGAVTYTPDPDFFGADPCTYTVDGKDAQTSNIATIEWVVAAVPDPPVAGDDAGVVDEDDSIIIDVVANDTDVDGDLDVTTVAVVTAAANGTTVVNPVTGEITYSPDSDFNGNDQFEYEISDATALSDTATVLGGGPGYRKRQRERSSLDQCAGQRHRSGR